MGLYEQDKIKLKKLKKKKKKQFESCFHNDF